MLYDDEFELNADFIVVHKLPCSHLPRCQFGQQSLIYL